MFLENTGPKSWRYRACNFKVVASLSGVGQLHVGSTFQLSNAKKAH
jgi:hypothetical protein